MTADNPESEQKVTEAIARAAFFAQTKPRSIPRLQQELQARFAKVPGIRTLYLWSSTHGWPRKAAEHDERVATKAAAVVEAKQVRTTAERAVWLMEQGERLVQLGVELAREGDPAALVRVGIDAMKHAEVMSGGVSDRTETLTEDPDAARQREVDRLMGLFAKIRPGNGAANGQANGHANGAADGADDTKH